MKKIAALILCVVATAAVQGTATAQNLSSSDRQFLRRAINDSQIEILLGQSAQTNASNAEVATYGAQLAADHTAAVAQAEALGMTVPDFTPAQQRFVNSFSRGANNNFDLRFINYSIQSHIRDINFFQNTALKSRDGGVRAFARAQLPVLTTHLVRALELRETLLGL